MGDREHWKKLLPIVQAYAEGKDIVVLGMDAKADDLRFNSPPDYYRIKKEPVLRPWKPEEVPVGEVIVYKPDRSSSRLILSRSGHNVVLAPMAGHTFGTICSSDHLLTYYTMKDGSPCGVME